ncbi:hypothetical protein I4641_12535 [Waterburya agarophytonicola K14]|uniref:Uncharacterized protein n=1 Tax=Waterburya agarophytonicola KI4 TaxID=2874699 RepID=A0A964FFI1_9CYAN|nr:hypothetical protein [Waterburya agarophytonicola]MCC0177805.1 hypothetical protein [Waterburya agarophytonicola KI4]
MTNFNTIKVTESTLEALHSKYIRNNNAVDLEFLNKLEVTNFIEEAISQDRAIAELMKSRFDVSYDKANRANKLTGEVVKVHQTRNGFQTKITINYSHGTVAVLREGNKIPNVYHTREYVILTFKADEKVNDSEVVSGIYPAAAGLYLLQNTVGNCIAAGDVEDLVQSLIGKVLVDRPIQAKEYYGRRNSKIEGQELDQQGIIETHKVSAIGVCPKFLGNKHSSAKNEQQTLEFCKADFNGNEIAVAAAFFLALGEPVFSDKNNKKYLVYGDGCRAAGVDLVDGKLVTLNPVPSDNGAKILNRFASHGFLKADNASIIIAGEESATYLSNLQFALSGGKTVRAAGVQVPVFVSFGAFGLNNGIMETNAAKNVEFKFEQVKNLNPIRIDLYSFEAEYLASLGNSPEEQLGNLKQEIEQFIVEWCKANQELKAHQVVKFNGIPVLANRFHFPVAINNHNYIEVRFGGADFNNQIRSLIVKTKAEVVSVKKSPKVRGLTKKATAYQTNTLVVKDGVAQDWVAILNRETIKGSSAVIDIFANDDEFIDSNVVWDKGVLTVDGKVWTQEDLIAWLDAKASTYVIKREVAGIVRDELNHLEGVEFIEEEGKLYAVETVKGFFGYSMMEVEVSTADENHGVSYLGLNEQQILSFASEKVGVALANLAGKQLDNADLLIGDKEIPVFKLPHDVEALRSFMDIKAEFRSKAWMGAMAKKALHGIRVEWDFAKRDGSIHTWAANLPFGVFLKYGSWDVAGNPAADIAPVISYVEDEDADVVSSNVLEDVFNFINIISSDNLSDLERKSLFLRSNVFSTWVNNLKTAKKANQFTKAGVAFHQKVVGDLTIGTDDKTGLPIVKVSSDNPMLKDKELNKLVKSGNAVVRANGSLAANRIAFLSRCPLPMFTAVVVKIDDSLDSSVIAINPVVWIKSNLGDFDGDLGYLTDAAQFGFNSPKDAVAFNDKFSAMSHHWDLFNKGEGVSPVEDALAVDAGVVGAAKTVKQLMESWTELGNEISVDEFIALASNVHNHYKYAVGKLYNNASALTQEIGNKAYNNGIESVTTAEFKALLESWFIYEETGLGGWSVKNEAKIDRLDEEVKAVLENKVMSEICSETERDNTIDLIDLAIGAVFFPGAALPHLFVTMTNGVSITSGNPRRRKALATQVKSEFNPLVVKGAANAVIGREVQNGKRDSEGNSSAVIAQATRLIARKQITDNEDNIFSVVDGIQSRFGKQISVISALRSQCQR